MNNSCPYCKHNITEDDLCLHVIAIYDLIFKEFVFLKNNPKLSALIEEYSSNPDFSDHLSQAFEHLLFNSHGAPGFSTTELYLFHK